MRLVLISIFLLAFQTFAHGYQNLTLKDCIELAKKKSLSLASAKLSEQTAESSLKQAKNARLPGLSGSMSQDVVNGVPFNDPSTFDYLNILGMRVNSSMPVFTGGRIGHSINQAAFRNEISKLNSEAVERNLSEQIIRVYMQVWSLMESENSAKAALALSKRLLAKDSILFQSGSFTATDLALAFAQVASDSLSLLQAQSNLTQNYTSLRQLLEIPQGTEFSLSPPDSAVLKSTEDFSALLKKAEENSINKRIDSLSILAANEAIGVANSGRWPSINLSAGAGTTLRWATDDPSYGAQLKNNFNYSASLGLSISIIDWGATSHNILSAQVAKEQQQISALNTQKQLENSIEQLALQVETYRLQWQVSSIQMEAQKLALDKSVQQHELGMLDISSLIQQQTIFNNSQIRHNQAKYSYLLGKSLLDLQIGNF
ncbi:MAG: TolC family protein [Fibromonadales bacterium]|nr:TolC family protein [Fibromonadales bacterium]